MTVPKVLIATPTYDGSVRIEYMRAVMGLTAHIAATGGAWALLTEKATMLHLMRSVMATKALVDGFTHLLFVDADVGFTAATVQKMLDADSAVIGAITPFRTLPLHETISAQGETLRHLVSRTVPYTVRFAAGTEQVRIDDRGLVEVDAVGTGLFLIRTDALQAMVNGGVVREMKNQFPFNQWLEHPIFWDFFDHRVEGGEYFSEDYSFCLRWRELGGKVHGLVDDELMHIGPIPIVGRYRDRLESGRI